MPVCATGPNRRESGCTIASAGSAAPTQDEALDTAPRGTGTLFDPRWRSVTLAVALSFAVVAFAELALSTAMPVAVQALHGLRGYAAVFGGFMAASLVGTITAGRLCDAGRTRPTALGALGCFALGALTCGGADGMAQLVLGRALQGLGGGGLTVALYVVVARRYPDAVRPRVFSMITSCWVLPSLVGPLAAGAVTDRLSWRWVFLGIAAAAALGALPLYRATAGTGPATAPEAAEGADESETGARRGGLPLALTAAAGAGLVQYAEAGRGSALGWAAAGTGLLLLALSVPRLLPRGTLRAAAGVPALVLLRGVAAAAFFTVESFVPLMLVDRHHLSPTLAGFSLTGAALSWTAASWYQGRRTDGDRTALIRSGAVVHALGTALALAAAFGPVPAWAAPLALVVSGFGMGLLLPSVGVLIMELSPATEQGANSASLELSDNLCSVLLVGLAGVLLHAPAGGGAGSGGSAFVLVFVPPLATALAAVALSARPLRAAV
ncbi:MFS transporter [Kitasatospora viridis]|uniref:MFS transporter n=1 Tax=Kitasatospora viridis TaxID=281105 RepID=A0A561UHV2_9ACTN|nr:MFS transporter [Kitasatospora viridis]TWF98930.1 MFS transporter [Kitasatospora viridis]